MMLLLFIALNLADGWATERWVRSGRREANPVMRWMMDIFGVVPGIAVMKLGLIALFASADNDKLTAIGCGIVALALAWNLYQWSKVR